MAEQGNNHSLTDFTSSFIKPGIFCITAELLYFCTSLPADLFIVQPVDIFSMN